LIYFQEWKNRAMLTRMQPLKLFFERVSAALSSRRGADWKSAVPQFPISSVSQA
jgi:hypothetical protein